MSWPKGGAAFRWRVFLFIFLLANTLRADQFDTLRSYWQTQLGSGYNVTTATTYWTSLNTNATRTNLWSDLPLGSVSANVTTTYGRLYSMAQAWAAPASSLFANPSLASAITNSLDWMVANSYTATATEYNNWWDWEIGSPQTFNNILTLMYPALTGTQITNCTAAIDGHSPPHNAFGTGANLTDICKVVLIRGIIGKNSAKMTFGQTNLSPVFPYVTSGDGFYTDGSFVQHTVIAYTGTYGNILLSDVAQLVNLLNGSTWQITDPNLNNVYSWVSNSFEPLVYHGAMMDMMRGRAISRFGETESSDGAGTIASVRSIAKFAPSATATAFNNWANAPFLSPQQFQFANMDRAVAWRNNFGIGLSLSSTRITSYESINGENLHGWFTGDGMTYLYLGNTETQFTGDFWPTVDPYHLPGTTVVTNTRVNAANSAAKTTQNWVGGAQVANTYGVSGMSLAAVKTTLTAKKSWFMLDNEMVCLGAGVTCGDNYGVDTTVEDRRLGTSPTNNFTVNGVSYPPTIGWNAQPASVSWCALDGVGGYYFPGGATNLQMSFVANTNSWSQINNGTYTSSTTNLLTDNYLKLWFSHGLKPVNSTYAYVVLPNFTASAMSTYAANPDIIVLANTTTVQAVSKPALGVVAANFWLDGNNSADLITVNKKSSVITLETLGGLSVGIADPTQTNTSSITVTLNRSASSVVSADAGVTVVQLSPTIILTVNTSGAHGKSFQAVFDYSGSNLTWDMGPFTTGAQDGGGFWSSGGNNWWGGMGSNVAWDDTTGYGAIFGAGSTAGTVTLLSAHTVAQLTFNPVASGSYKLTGAGPLSISNGIVANASATIIAGLNLLDGQCWIVPTNQTLTIGGIVTAPTPTTLTILGAGTVSLSSTNQLGTNIVAINFADIQNTTTLNLAGGVQPMNAPVVNDGVAAAVTGGGTLQLSSSNWYFGSPNHTSVTLDLSGLGSFTFNSPGNTFSVGPNTFATSGAGTATLKLAATNNITAANLLVAGFNGLGQPGFVGALTLGQINNFNANTINLGFQKQSSSVAFASGLTNPSVTIRASDGISPATMTVGWQNNFAAQSTTATFNVSNGTLDAQLTTLLLGNASDRDGVTTANFVMGGGTLTTSNLTIGQAQGATSGSSYSRTGNGTFELKGGNVAANTITLGNNIAATGTGTATASGTLLLDSGTLRTEILQAGANSGGSRTGTFIWADGTLGNLTNSDLSVNRLNLNLANTGNISGTHTVDVSGNQTATVTASFVGAGALSKTGSGVLILAGANTYSGNTIISNGVLVLNGSLAGTVTAAAGATLSGNGAVTGSVIVNGLISPGNNSVGTLTTGSETWNSGGALGFQLTNATNIFGQDLLAINGALDLAATTNNPFTIQLISSSGLPGFAFGSNYVWTLATTSGGITHFNPSTFVMDVSHFSNSFAGIFSVNTNGNSLNLIYTATITPVIGSYGIVGPGVFTFNFSGASGQSFRVLSSTNLLLPLTNWWVLTNGTASASVMTYTDLAATNPAQFYRVVSP